MKLFERLSSLRSVAALEQAVANANMRHSAQGFAVHIFRQRLAVDLGPNDQAQIWSRLSWEHQLRLEFCLKQNPGEGKPVKAPKVGSRVGSFLLGVLRQTPMDRSEDRLDAGALSVRPRGEGCRGGRSGPEIRQPADPLATRPTGPGGEGQAARARAAFGFDPPDSPFASPKEGWVWQECKQVFEPRGHD